MTCSTTCLSAEFVTLVSLKVPSGIKVIPMYGGLTVLSLSLSLSLFQVFFLLGRPWYSIKVPDQNIVLDFFKGMIVSAGYSEYCSV